MRALVTVVSMFSLMVLAGCGKDDTKIKVIRNDIFQLQSSLDAGITQEALQSIITKIDVARRVAESDGAISSDVSSRVNNLVISGHRAGELWATGFDCKSNEGFYEDACIETIIIAFEELGQPAQIAQQLRADEDAANQAMRYKGQDTSFMVTGKIEIHNRMMSILKLRATAALNALNEVK